MRNNGLEGYYAKKCFFFLKFAQELLKNGEGYEAQIFSIILVSLFNTRKHCLWGHT